MLKNFKVLLFARFSPEKTLAVTILRLRNSPVNVELVKIRTILELTGGKFSSEPAKIVSIVRSSILVDEWFPWEGPLSSETMWLPVWVFGGLTNYDVHGSNTFSGLNEILPCFAN